MQAEIIHQVEVPLNKRPTITRKSELVTGLGALARTHEEDLFIEVMPIGGYPCATPGYGVHPFYDHAKVVGYVSGSGFTVTYQNRRLTAEDFASRVGQLNVEVTRLVEASQLPDDPELAKRWEDLG